MRWNEYKHFQNDKDLKFSSHVLFLRKLLKDMLQENKEGKQEREGNEIQKAVSITQVGGGAVIWEGKSQTENWLAVLDSNQSRLEQEVVMVYKGYL